MSETAFGRTLRAALPMNRAVLHRLGLSVGIAFALAGCQEKTLTWYEIPNDPRVYALTLDRCLNSTRGPERTRYNDWDEAIRQCQSAAEAVSRYCEPTAVAPRLCPPSSVRLADVRAAIAMETREGGNAVPSRSDDSAGRKASLNPSISSQGS